MSQIELITEIRPTVFKRKYNTMLEIYEYIDIRKEKRPDDRTAMNAYIASLENNSLLQSNYINELQAAASCLLMAMNCNKPVDKHWDRLSELIQKKTITNEAYKLIRKWYE